jgi:hypothetical protein
MNALITVHPQAREARAAREAARALATKAARGLAITSARIPRFPCPAPAPPRVVERRVAQVAQAQVAPAPASQARVAREDPREVLTQFPLIAHTHRQDHTSRNLLQKEARAKVAQDRKNYMINPSDMLHLRLLALVGCE